MYDFVAKKAEKDADTRKLIQDARKLAPFVDDMAWQALRQKFEEKKESLLASITRRQMRGEVVDQREIDLQRGFYLGVEAVLNEPDKVIEHLETAARMAYIAVGDEYTPD